MSEAARLSEEERLDWLQLIRNDNVVAARLPRPARSVRQRAGGARRAPGLRAPRTEDVLVVLRPILGAPLQRLAQDAAAIPIPPAAAEPDDGERARIVALLGPIPVSIDGCALPLLACGQVLLELAVAGRLCRQWR